MLRSHQAKTCKGTCQQAFSRNSLVIPTAEAVRLSVVGSNSSDFWNAGNSQSGGRPRAQIPEIQLSDVVDACSYRVGEPPLDGPQPDAALGLASFQSGACSQLGARTRLCVRASARAPARGPREALGSQWGGAPRAEGGATTRAPRDPARGLRRGSRKRRRSPAPAGVGEAAVSALGFVNPAMGPDATVAWRRSLLLPRLLLVPLLWSGLALGALALVSSPHRVLHDLLSEQQLLEVEDLSLTLLQGGRLGPLSLPPDLPNLDPECRELLLDFANSSAELTGCLVRSARPVRLCQTCYPLFQQVANKMDNISRAVGVGRGAHPGPPAWRVGKGGCNDGLLWGPQFPCL